MGGVGDAVKQFIPEPGIGKIVVVVGEKAPARAACVLALLALPPQNTMVFPANPTEWM